MTWATDRLDQLKGGDVVLPPVVQTLQLGGLDDWGEGWARKTWTPAQELLNADGSLFGGYIAALADQILAFAAMTVAPGDAMFRTSNLKVDFIRVGKAEILTIEGRVVAGTKSMIHVEADFRRPDGELIARASAQQMVVPFGG
ncbi:thioesterase [Caulobacter sp. Root1455]|uniref:PaaI family thioesterase n=1 Tax=Caulobacter sp. Root1455 TaxID=1736465 RepID=UPI0006F31C67|nr:PaaI family thioesterase [Caulobacter sp. Root1455]KQY92692.1 thioesterase [Caulobacter sp. Root1455]